MHWVGLAREVRPGSWPRGSWQRLKQASILLPSATVEVEELKVLTQVAHSAWLRPLEGVVEAPGGLVSPDLQTARQGEGEERRR